MEIANCDKFRRNAVVVVDATNVLTAPDKNTCEPLLLEALSRLEAGDRLSLFGVLEDITTPMGYKSKPEDSDIFNGTSTKALESQIGLAINIYKQHNNYVDHMCQLKEVCFQTLVKPGPFDSKANFAEMKGIQTTTVILDRTMRKYEKFIRENIVLDIAAAKKNNNTPQCKGQDIRQDQHHHVAKMLPKEHMPATTVHGRNQGSSRPQLSDTHLISHALELSDYEISVVKADSYESKALSEFTRPYISFNGWDIHSINRLEASGSHNFVFSQAQNSLNHEQSISMPVSSTSGSSSPSSSFCSSTTTSCSSTPSSTPSRKFNPIYARPRRPAEEQVFLAMLQNADNDGPYQPTQQRRTLRDGDWDYPPSIIIQYPYHERRETDNEFESFHNIQNLHNILSANDSEKNKAAVATRKKSIYSSQEQGEASLNLSFNYNASTLTQRLRLFEFVELENATNGFSKDNFLEYGNDGFFRGTLTTGQSILVKENKLANFQGEELFSSTVARVDKAQHPNIMSLIGFSVERHMLIYEDVTNKSLEWHLSSSNPNTLTWPIRQRIAVGTARGLSYLHEGRCFEPIVHGDMTSKNILLTPEYEPKIAGTGLKWQPDDIGAETCVIGEPGYLAPEYINNGTFTEKTDVYAYGVILLELIAGVKANFRTPQHSCLTEWARHCLGEGHVGKLVDERIKDSAIEDELCTMAQAAYLCIDKSPQGRPAIQKVLRMLESGKSQGECLTFRRDEDASSSHQKRRMPFPTASRRISGPNNLTGSPHGSAGCLSCNRFARPQTGAQASIFPRPLHQARQMSSAGVLRPSNLSQAKQISPRNEHKEHPAFPKP